MVDAGILPPISESPNGTLTLSNAPMIDDLSSRQAAFIEAIHEL